MTYFGFLGIFLVIPITILAVMGWVDKRNGRTLPPQLRNWPPYAAIALHVVIAVIYTTPWDNYLVATRVWWYDPELVTGIVIGWVPIEEYTFFVLQPIMAGLWLLFLARRMTFSATPAPLRPSLRVWSVVVLAVLWLVSVAILVFRWQPGTYLGLELAWALLPIMIQVGFGADILWRYRKLVFWVIAPMALYLSAADYLAIGWGTWTIDPAQSTGLMIGGVLPIEELIFFLITNVLLTFGVTLILAEESHERIAQLRQTWAQFRASRSQSDNRVRE
jgi:lycopene cyclase domain-containing protein